MLAHIACQHAARHLAYALFGAQHRASQRLGGKGGLLEAVEHDVVWRIVRLPDLLQDHAALALKLLRLEGGVGQDVTDDVGGQRGIFLQYLGVIGGLFAGRVGVQMAAHRLDFLGDLRRRAAFGAFERHMLQEMRDAILYLGFVAGAGGDIGAQRDGLDPLHPFSHDREAGGQSGQANCFGHVRQIPFSGPEGGNSPILVRRPQRARSGVTSRVTSLAHPGTSAPRRPDPRSRCRQT